VPSGSPGVNQPSGLAHVRRQLMAKLLMQYQFELSLLRRDQQRAEANLDLETARVKQIEIDRLLDGWLRDRCTAVS